MNNIPGQTPGSNPRGPEEGKNVGKRIAEMALAAAAEVAKSSVTEPVEHQHQHHPWEILNVSPDDKEFDLACPECGAEIGSLRSVSATRQVLRRLEELGEKSAVEGNPEWTAGSRASFMLAAGLLRKALEE